VRIKIFQDFRDARPYVTRPIAFTRDYAAALATTVKNWFLRPLGFGENFPKEPFLKPNPIVDRIIAQLPLKKEFFLDFWHT
jgi:hypothetical protein